MGTPTRHQLRQMRRKNLLLGLGHADIDREIEKIDNPDKKPLPERSLKSLQKKYKELRDGIEHIISIDGIQIKYQAYWDGWDLPWELSTDTSVENWEFVTNGQPKCSKSLVSLIQKTDLFFDIDDQIKDDIFCHKTFTSYQTKIIRLIEKVREYEEKYQFTAEEIA